MKKLLSIIVLCAAVIGLHAQTNTPATPTPAQNFISASETWFTTIDYTPALAWTNGMTLELAIGYSQVTGDPAASVVDGQYDIGRFNLGATFQYFGLGSSVNEAQFQAGYAILQRGSLKAETDLRVGYDFISNDEVVEPALMLKKKMPANTFAQIGVSLPFEFKRTFSRNPTFFAETGFTF